MTEHYYDQEYFSLEYKKEVKKQVYNDQYNLLIAKLETLLNEEYELSYMQGVQYLVPVISERIEVEMMLYKLYDSISSDFHYDNKYIRKFANAPKMILQLRINIADKYAANEDRKQEELIHHYHNNAEKHNNTNTTVDYTSWLDYIPNPMNLFSQ